MIFDVVMVPVVLYSGRPFPLLSKDLCRLHQYRPAHGSMNAGMKDQVNIMSKFLNWV